MRGAAAAIQEVIVPAPAHKNCSNHGENCTASKCCLVAGHQCFRKNAMWSACRPTCTPGPDPTDPVFSPWSCDPLGPKTPGVAPPPDYTVRPAAWVAQRCAGPGKNCSESRCCGESGHSCYLKVKGWAACKADCVPGPDPTDNDDHPWDCKVLGQRTPGPDRDLRIAAPWVAQKCAAKHENCMASRCCKDAGHQCFLKQGQWAMCMPHCKQGPLLTDANNDIWKCEPLGGRTPGMATVTEHQPLAPWVKTTCAKAGENCTASMCCAQSTMQCYEKDKAWSGCLRGCKPGIHKDDKAGGPWSCKRLGPRTPRPWGTPSLYCWSVTRLASYEANILRYQVKTDGGIGIFGCDLADVFASDGFGFIGDGPNGAVWTHHFRSAPVGVSVDGTAANTQLFINVWNAVRQVGKYALTDWTLKVDPDAILVASRIRQHLLPHTGRAVYIKNCNSPTLIQQGPSMFGSVEAISKLGLQKYFEPSTKHACEGNFQWGEDRWISDCFNKIGVQGLGDWHIEGDKLCVGVGVGPDCTDGRAAYHPYKSERAYRKCYRQACYQGATLLENCRTPH